jgi:hypothetical protein
VPIVALVIVNLVVGGVLAPHYGQSTDEEANILFARATFLSYQHPGDPYVDPAREDKGPFYLMVWLKAGEFLGRVIPGWLFADGRHYVNFLAFQLALVSIYGLSLRFVRPLPALAGVLLFETQPVFFGHAFINQKDAPFMAFFAATLALGIGLVDQFVRAWEKRAAKTDGAERLPSSWDVLRQGWLEDSARARRVAVLAGALVLVLPALRVLLNLPLRSAIETVIFDAYRGQSWPPINQLFARLAENAARVAPEAYVLRALRLMDVAAVAASGLMVLVAVAVATRRWPSAQGRFWPAVVAEGREGLGAPIPVLFYLAAVVFGMAIAIRSMALFAGLLVVAYSLARAGPRITILMTLYFGAAGLTAYALWPQLWGSPASMITASLDRTIQFPQLHRTLFEGVTLLSDSMPPRYLPELMAIQFTLPALLLIAIGFAAAARSAIGRGAGTLLAGILALWALVPFVAVVVFGVPIYNYFRHVLFMMPPLFVVAAIGIERVWRLVPVRWGGPVLAVALLLPGIWAIGQLHPYEYGYFNEFVGGVRGAYGRFMSDYWCTSLREAMSYVNANAPPSAAIAVTGPESNAIPFAREDLRVRDDAEMLSNEDFQPVMILGCAWSTIDPAFFPDAPLLWTVEREGVPLAVVKLLATPQP